MKYLDYMYIVALVMLWTFSSLAIDNEEIRFPNLHDIADGLNHKNRLINAQYHCFTIDSLKKKDFYQNVESVEIIQKPVWNTPEKYYFPSLKDFRNLIRFSINVSVRIKFFDKSWPDVSDTLRINFQLPDKEGFPSKQIILGNKWKPENFAIVTPSRKAFYNDQQYQKTFLCPHITSRTELFTQLRNFYRMGNRSSTWFDYAGNSWFLPEKVRRTLTDWDDKYTIIFVGLINSPQFRYVNDVIRASCLYSIYFFDSNYYVNCSQFSLNTFIRY